MNRAQDFESFRQLIDALRPWLEQIVIVGGWAHCLYREHPLAQERDYPPLATLDTDIAVPAKLQSEAFALRNLPSDQERFGVGSAAADLERAEILVPVTVGHFRARFYPQAELIEIRDADRAIAHPLGQMLPYPSGQAVPALELRH